jgi:excisionase family DNA binding protein
MGKDFMTAKEAAEYLGLHENTVYKLLKARKLPGAQLGDKWVIRRKDIEALFPKRLRKEVSK